MDQHRELEARAKAIAAEYVDGAKPSQRKRLADDVTNAAHVYRDAEVSQLKAALERLRTELQDERIKTAALEMDVDRLKADLARAVEALTNAEPFIHPEIRRGPAIDGWTEMAEAVNAVLFLSPTSTAALDEQRRKVEDARAETWEEAVRVAGNAVPGHYVAGVCAHALKEKAAAVRAQGAKKEPREFHSMSEARRHASLKGYCVICGWPELFPNRDKPCEEHAQGDKAGI